MYKRKEYSSDSYNELDDRVEKNKSTKKYLLNRKRTLNNWADDPELIILTDDEGPFPS